MKKVSLLFLLTVLSNLLIAQTKQEALKTDTILWFGLDFSNARFIDESAFKSPVELKNKLFKQWNRLLLEEPEKYDIPKFFKVSAAKTELGEVYRRNENVDPAGIVLDMRGMDYCLNESKIKEIIGQYETDFNGYGLVLIMESFNKIKAQGSMWVTYFYIPTKEVVFTKRMVGEAGGIGIKNYWVASVYNVFEKSRSEKSDWLRE
jgi:hypothetical protein